MGLDVMQGEPLAIQEPLQRADLVDRHGRELFGGELHFAAAEALDVREARVGSDLDVVFLAEADGIEHDEGVSEVVCRDQHSISSRPFCKREEGTDLRGVEAACDVCVVYQRHQVFVGTADVVSVGFA